MDPITSTGAAASSAAGSSSFTGIADNFDTFLTLLTTQLQNQDPLSPMDSTQFTEQLVQFTEVEQSIQANDNLEQAIALLTANNTASAVNYIGRQVETAGAVNGLVNGSAKWRYVLDEPTDATTITVHDETGKLVYSTIGGQSAGSHEFTWDGKDNAGTQLPDGAYSITVSGQNGDGQVVDATVFASGTVTSVKNTQDGTVLMLGDAEVPLADVIEILTAEAAG